MGRIFGRLKKRANKIGWRVGTYQEAITFAEVGEQRHAQKLFQPDWTEEKAAKLLVVGRESTFSKEIVDYALDMAKRLSYEILALNTAPLSCETFKLFSSSQKKICEDFRALSENNVKPFQEAAEKLGISFTHVVKFNERDEALEEANRKFGNIEFVISDTEEEQAVDRAEKGERPRQAIYVYSMV